MPCIVAFVILGIMSLFSATHRALAKEAFDCVFRRVTFRPCNTGFQEKIKAGFTAKFATHAPWLARFINKRFELLAWVFMIITLGSLFWAGHGVYNFYLYGSCNGLNDTGLCLLDPTGENNRVSPTESCERPLEQGAKELTLEGVDLSAFPRLERSGDDEVVFIGCVNCEYSRQVYNLVFDLATEQRANFTFAHYPIKSETTYITDLLVCAQQQNSNRIWALIKRLFGNEPSVNASTTDVLAEAADLGYDFDQLAACMPDPATASTSAELTTEIAKTNLYGTPIVFINGQAFVGPKPLRVYRNAF